MFAVGWLALVWVALWEDPSLANILVGAAIGTAAVAAVPLTPGEARPAIRPWPALRLLVYFLWKLVEASLVVAWEVVTPRIRINEAIVAVPIHGVSEGFTTVVANMITLTPGTVVVEVRENPTILYVHVLHFRGVERVRQDVRALEEMVMEAFAPARVLAEGRIS